MSNPFTIVIQLLVRALLYLLLTETHLFHTGKNSAIQMAFYTVSYEYLRDQIIHMINLVY